MISEPNINPVGETDNMNDKELFDKIWEELEAELIYLGLIK